METILIVLGILALIIYGIYYVFVRSLRNPFTYPIIAYSIDISGRKKPSYEECMDQWVIDNKNYDATKDYNETLNEWDNKCKEILEETHLWRKRKTEMYNEMRKTVYNSEYKIFQYDIFRNQLRYNQSNYQRNSYSVRNSQYIYKFTLKELLEIYDELEEIDFETTRQKYNSQNQRKLMTKELRRKIIERDNFTCQKCGKYMPDEVGLHVDHIVAIKNGGKTVESNLQVLCDKCNYRKGAKN